MAGGDIVFQINNQSGLPVVFDKIERANADVVNGNESIAKTIPPNTHTTIRLTRPWLSLTVEATLFYHFFVEGKQVDFHAYGYSSTSFTGKGESSRYDLRAAGITPNQTITLNGKTYSANLNAKKVLCDGSKHPVTGNVVQFYEYHIDIVLNVH